MLRIRASPPLAMLLALPLAELSGQEDIGTPAAEVSGVSVFMSGAFHRLTGAGAAGFEARPFWSAGLIGRAGPGSLFGQVDISSFVPEEPDRAGYAVLAVFGGFLIDLRLPGATTLAIGPTAGMLRISGPHLAGPTEDEIVMGGRAELRLPRWRGWELAIVGDAQRVAYREPVDLDRLGIRLGRALPIPVAVVGHLIGAGAAKPSTEPIVSARTAATSGFSLPDRTLTRETLSRSGVIRFQDLGTLLGGWSMSSPNGVESSMVAPGGLPRGTEDWRVFVDNVEYPLEILGTRSLTRLPMSIAHVDSVQVFDGPGVVGGRIVTGGALHFFTNAPSEPRIAVQVSGWNGAGDPGLQVPATNLDRLGGTHAGTIGYGTDSGGVAFEASTGGLFLTDPPINRRVRSLSPEGLPGGSHTTLERYGVAGHLYSSGGSHSARLASVGGRDFVFVDPLGGERLAENRVRWGSVSGGWRLSDRSGPQLTYRSGFTRRSLLALPSVTGTGLGFEEDVLDIGATLLVDRWSVTLDTRQIRARSTRFKITDPSTGWARVNVGRFGAGWSALVSGGQQAGEASFEGLATWRRTLSRTMTAQASFLVGWGSGESLGSLWFWYRRGYGLLGAEGITVSEAEKPRAAFRLSSNVRLRHRDEQGTRRAEFGIRIRRGPPVQLALHRIDVRDGRPIPRDSLTLVSNVYGGRASSWLDASKRWDMITVGARLDRELGVWGDALWVEGWREVPASQTRLSVDVRPAPDIDVGMTLRYQSETSWSTWNVPGSEVSGTVPGGIELDVSGRKTLWAGRLAASMRIEDILDRDQPSHPFGHSPGLRLNLGVTLALD